MLHSQKQSAACAEPELTDTQSDEHSNSQLTLESAAKRYFLGVEHSCLGLESREAPEKLAALNAPIRYATYFDDAHDAWIKRIQASRSTSDETA